MAVHRLQHLGRRLSHGARGYAPRVALQNYLAEEIALDCAEGLLSRREAMRRLTLLGIGAAAATSLLAGCGSDNDDAGSTAATSGGAATSAASPSSSTPATNPAPSSPAAPA